MRDKTLEAAFSAAYQEEVRDNIARDGRLGTASLVMNALATVVACEGLFSNSPAVVIGAMIIAVLLGPIIAIALSLVVGNNTLLRQALLSEAAGVLVVLSVAFALGVIHRDLPLTVEILSRVSPNLLDLVIALAGGAAGAYATISPRLSVGLVGVAIATALVPPLAVAGICAARGDTHLAAGAFLLFFANAVAIQAASSVVMWLHGYRQVDSKTAGSPIKIANIAVSLVLLAGLLVVLGLNFRVLVAKQEYESSVRARLEEALRSFPGAYLVALRFEPNDTKNVVTAVLRTPSSLEPDQVAALETKLPTASGKQVELHIRSVITTETTRSGHLYTVPHTLDDIDPDASK